ncbi:MAG: SUMF1/EgtB/PvdO family nonheme iron enzyme [Kiritimatiellae bacterium]|nr:SUMF1/EgtB/PvdO family nonheme iron enzyme [Kiritimatiellia bacterium]
MALFYALRDATVKDLTLRGGKIEARNRAAGIAARLWGGTLIENCTVDLEVTAYGDSAGGVFCWQENALPDQIVRSRSLAAVTSYAAVDRAGGICATSWGTLLLDTCYASGSATGHGTEGRVGGLVAFKESGTLTISNSYHNVRLQGGYLGGDLVGNGDGQATIVGSPTVLDGFPKGVMNLRTRGNGSGTVALVDGEVVATPDEGSAFIRFEGLPPAEGEFNETTVWAVFGKAVATEEDLRAVTAKGFFVQTAEIDMTGSGFIGLHYDPMFQGEYDGAGHGVYGLTIDANNDYTGLFRRTQGAILKNIRLIGGTVKGRHYVGSLVGWQYAGVVEDCLTTVDVVATGNHGGGLVGVAYANYSTIRRCAAKGNVTISGSYAGGLTSYTNGGGTRIHDCYATGDVTAGSWAGGFISHGDNAFTIENCYSTGKVTAGSNVGGFYFRGDSAEKVVGCFWDRDTSECGVSGLGYGCSTDEMQSAATFAGWSGYDWLIADGGYPELISLMAASETYTVRWEDEDGSLLAEDSNVRMGQTPRYPASVPAKASADGVHYLFDGWSPSVRPTSGDITYRATYRAIDKMWMTVDLKTGEVSYQNYDFTTATNVFNTEAYKTTKMAFRLVPRGHYWVQDGLKRGYMANDYYIGMFEVTKAQYALMLNPENTLSDLGNTSLIPQSLVSWENLRGTNGVTAQGCVTNLTGEHAIWKFDQLTGLAFDLPTDAMWEVATRAMPLEDVSHATWPWFFGQTSDSIDLYAWRRSNSGGGNLQPVGQKLPNAWGLYDVYGNVWEWCADGIGDRLWRQTPNADDDPACKYCRGSSSDKDGDRLDLMRSSFINTAYTVGSYQHIGFRLSLIVRNKEPGEHCTVRWVNDDGAELLTDADVEVDAMPSYTGETPTKASDAKYDYAFIGWSPDIEPVADDITFTAVYRAMLRSYTVTWEDEDGTVLEVDRNVAVGRTPRFDGGIPKKAMSDGVVYSFMGWTPEVVPVAGDVTYRATYRASRERTWMTVDLRTGVVGYWDLDFTAATNLFNTEEYKTTKMAFRRVEKGNDYFVQNGAYTANMTNSYYIGLFEVTVAQYALMQNPSAHLANDVASLRSQGYCNRTKVRGIAEAPVAFGEGITAASPLGCLNALVQKANGDGRLVFDLPTEAMWEVAVRAVESGNTAHREWNYHFGADNTDLALYGFMASNNEADAYGFTSGMRVPGCKLPNAWGLYDMYGNARDLCLDGHSGATDNWSLTPYLGDGSYRNWQRDRGGAYNDAVSYTSSTRSYHDSGGYDHNGFRLARICTDDEEISRPIHTVTWLDADGTLLQRDEVVAGGYVRYRGATPTKARDGMTVYTFRGWTPAVSSVVTADATYTAVYEAVDVMLPDDWETAEWTFDESDLSLQSKAIGHGGSTVVHLGVKGPGLLTFTWKVSSEGNYDFLRFYRGESQIAAISGGTDWIVVSNRVDDAEAVTFAWAYTKDGSASSGSDCGWIKEIRWIPDAAGTQVFVCGQSVEFERGADGRTLTATVPAGTETADVRVKVDGIDVSKGFALSVEGTVLNATLLAPFEVPAEAGASNGIWTENGDGTVTLNVTIVPGLYYAVASAASLDGFKCPGAAAPATGETKLTVPKPASDKGFFKVWVSDAPIPPEP